MNDNRKADANVANATTLKKPVDWDELYPGRFLKAGEFRGKKVMLTVKDIELDELESDSGKKVKGIVSFKETTKQIPLNKTNGICLREMFGRTLTAWPGKRVALYEGIWNGEPCIRVWGSPDIEQDRTITVQLPRKKPFQMTMHKIGGKPGGTSAPNPAPPPPPEDVGDQGPAFDGFEPMEEEANG